MTKKAAKKVTVESVASLEKELQEKRQALYAQLLSEREEMKRKLADVDKALADQFASKHVTPTGAVKKSSLRKRMNGTKSERKQFIADAIESAQFSRSEIVNMYVQAFGDGDNETERKLATTVRTYLSDAKNAKYCSFRALAVEKDGVFQFVE